MRLLGLTLLSLLAACRFGFDAVAPIDAAMVDTPPDGPPPVPPIDAPTVLACAPVRFAIDATTEFITAVGTRQGYDVFAVDGSNAVRGYAYRFVNDKLELVAGTGNLLPVPSSVGPVAAIAVEYDPGDDVDVVIAVPYPDVSAARRTTPATNMITAVGTVVIPFNAQLQRIDMPEMATQVAGLVAGPGALAGGDRGTVAFLGRDSAEALGLQPVSRRGVTVPGGPYPVDATNHPVTRQTLLRAATGYLGVWSDNVSMPHEAIFAAPIDDNLVARAPVTISDPEHGAFVPAAAYLPGAHRYLFGWMEKPGRDLIRLSMRDEQLAGVPGAIDGFMQDGTLPIFAAGDNDFLVVWLDTSSAAPQRLGAARVAPDGNVLLPGVTSTGGNAVAFDVVVHNGQPALFWVEKHMDGTTNLWIDALCL